VPGSIPNIISDLPFNAVILRCARKQKYKNNPQKFAWSFAVAVYGVYHLSSDTASAIFKRIGTTFIRYSFGAYSLALAVVGFDIDVF
jgi:hypothetical protein